MQRQVETGNLWGVQKLRRVRFRTSALPFARLGTPQLMVSRTLVLVGGAALAVGALRALFLILQSVQVCVVFGVIAIFLLVMVGVLAATRDRLGIARSAAARSWHKWA